jgi:hypothetical protein
MVEAMKHLTLQRNGTFHVVATGLNHCGITGDMDVQYALKCVCDTKSLDSRGFLVDQLSIDACLQAITTTNLSCEALTIDIARKLYKAILRENPKCMIMVMELTLSPSPFLASMTFTYEAKKELDAPKRKVVSSRV